MEVVLQNYFKSIKPNNLADKIEFLWLTVNEYLFHEPAPVSDEEKRSYCGLRGEMKGDR